MENIDNNASSTTKDDVVNSEIETAAQEEGINPDAIRPNDPSYNRQWGLEKINAPAAWNYAQGSKSVVVAVVDTGIDYKHPDLAANIWTNTKEISGNGIDDDNNGYVDDIHGWDFGDNDGDPNENDTTKPSYGHGTHVAGILGAVGNNNLGITGVSPNVSIMATKHYRAGDSQGYLWDVPKGIRYAVDNGAKIINLSLGSSSFDQAQLDALTYANQQGVLVIASAGNNGRDNDVTPYYPANYDLPNIITVASLDKNETDKKENEKLSSTSSYGAQSIDIAAPGVKIYSTFPNAQYATWGGTSMAAPLVAGAAALLLGANPKFTVLELRHAILSSVQQVASLQGKVNTGGYLDLSQLSKFLPKTGSKPDNLINNAADPSATEAVRIQAENYNDASDTTPNNEGRIYRSDLGVDIESSADNSGGFNVTGMKAGEWLKYSFQANAGFYKIVFRVAGEGNGQKQLQAVIDNQLERSVSFAATGGNQLWTDAIAQGVSLSAGIHELRLNVLSDDFNLNYIDLIPTTTAYGGSGNDTISGNADNNTIYGGAGDDSLSGASGNDTIYGNDGNDSIDGGNGDDVLNSENGNDTITGGAGNDTANGGAGNDRINSGPGNDNLNGEGGNDNLSGEAGNDNLNGGSSNDTLTGGAGNDTLIGGNGRDVLTGGDSNDVLIGGLGNDTLTGGLGRDIFVFDSLSDRTDAIADFSRSDGDKIKIGSSFGTNLSLFSYDNSTGALTFNNGTNPIQLATLNTNSLFSIPDDIIF
ncbi:S8 family serine peptidase [Calothrix sp. FACHB-156]|nr:S8 family serine peptidase [Calothrix sp. FACHB-156]